MDVPRARRRLADAGALGVVQTCGLGIDEVLLYLLVHDAHLDELLAQVCATAVVTVSTFVVNRAWTFRMDPAADPAG